MTIQQSSVGQYEIIHLEGEDSTVKDASLFDKTIKAVVDQGTRFIAVNFENAQYLASDIINIILSTYNTLKKQNGELVLIGSAPKILETIEVIGLSMILPIYVDQEAFVQDRLETDT